MSRSARSLFVFGCYVVAAGATFLAVPQAVPGLIGLPALSDGWMRVIGLLALVIGAYDLVGAKCELRPYVRASVWVRVAFAAGVAAVVAAGQMPPALLQFGAVDLAGAIWTAVELRRESGASPAAS